MSPCWFLRRTVLFALLLACVLYASASAEPILPWVKGSRNATAEAKFQAGRSALSRGDLAAAEAAFTDSLRLDANTVGSVLGLAQVALKRGDVARAGAYLQQALTTAPDSAEAQVSWGRFSYASGNVADAEAALKKAATLDTSTVVPRIDLGDLYLTAFHKPAEAIVQYQAALKLAPQHAGAHYALGVALAAERRWDDAKAALGESAKLSPQNPLPPYTLGRVFLETKQPDQALNAFSASLAAQPKFAPARMERGSLYMGTNDDARAIQDFQAALQTAPKLADAHVKIGMIHQRHARVMEAEAAYRAAIAIEPRHALAYNNLAWMAAEQRIKLAEALRWATRAVTLAPQVPDFQDTLAWVHRARGDRKSAELVLLKSTATKPARADFFYHLGVVQHELGKRQQALAGLNRALTLDSNFPNAEDARRRIKELTAGL